MLYFDIHNHSKHSRDAKDEPERIVCNAIECGLDAVGISDHNYWITGTFPERLAELRGLGKKYKDKISVIAGMEVSFLQPDGIQPEKLGGFDYCLLEYFIQANVPFEEVCRFADRFPCRVGIAHTDIFNYDSACGGGVLELMAQHDIFWELNVNYDTIHAFREHEYCKKFMSDSEQQKKIKELNIQLSVGFDTHDLADYIPERVRRMCEFIGENKFSVPDFLTGA